MWFYTGRGDLPHPQSALFQFSKFTHRILREVFQRDLAERTQMSGKDDCAIAVHRIPMTETMSRLANGRSILAQITYAQSSLIAEIYFSAEAIRKCLPFF